VRNEWEPVIWTESNHSKRSVVTNRGTAAESARSYMRNESPREGGKNGFLTFHHPRNAVSLIIIDQQSIDVDEEVRRHPGSGDPSEQVNATLYPTGSSATEGG
jgi:hypothetical protein